MQGDIYATKGIEYLIVIAYLLVLVGMLRLLTSRRVARAIGMKPRPEPGRPRPWFLVAEGYGFHQGHTWAAHGDGDVVTVGLDDFAGKLLGAPDAIDLPAVGQRVRQGERGWHVQLDGKSVGMVSPVDGKVVAVNPAVLENPALATSQPYQDGWLLQVRVPNGRTAMRNLLQDNLAVSWMRDTVERLRQMPAGELGVVMPDGGVPVPGFGRQLDPEHWDDVARAFFMTD